MSVPGLAQNYSTSYPGTALGSIAQSQANPPLIHPVIQSFFSVIQSNQFVSVNQIVHRSEFMEKMKDGKWPVKPVVIAHSPFVPKAFVEHLMRNKKDSALGVKYEDKDKITNMEGALHTFVTPICPITMLGDYAYVQGHRLNRFFEDRARQLILSALVQPDFEYDVVVMKLVEATEQAVEGITLPADFQPLWNQCRGNMELFQKEIPPYERKFQQHMVYHLTTQHRLPALREIRKQMNFGEASSLFEQLIPSSQDPLEVLKDQFVSLNGHALSLEALFHLYLNQLRNEFTALEELLPQGYVYTIDPPAIFAQEIGGVPAVSLLNKIQILAFKQLKNRLSFNNLMMLGFNDYADPGAISLFRTVFPEKAVMPKKDLFADQGQYSIKDGFALVLHNNSDAFGQNIETEGATSMDGVIGVYSDAVCHLRRDRSDLLIAVIEC